MENNLNFCPGTVKHLRGLFVTDCEERIIFCYLIFLTISRRSLHFSFCHFVGEAISHCDNSRNWNIYGILRNINAHDHSNINHGTFGFTKILNRIRKVISSNN